MDDEANKAFNSFLVFCYFGQNVGFTLKLTETHVCLPHQICKFIFASPTFLQITPQILRLLLFS